MLTFEINDAQLERRILEKAQAIGKSAQELLKDILTKAIQEEVTPEILPFEVPKLDYRQYVKIIDEPVDDAVDDTPLFQNDTDTVTFTKQLREQAWKRGS